MRLWTAPHQVANLYTNYVAIGTHISSIFDISKLYLLKNYSVIPILPFDQNVVRLDVYSALIAANVVWLLPGLPL